MAIEKVELADGSTRYRVRVFVGRDPATGKRTVITRTFDRWKDADREARRLEGSKDMGALTAPSREPLTTFLRHWLDNVKAGRIRARTLADYRDLLGRFVFEPPEGAPPIGAIRLDRLAGPAFEALYAHLWSERGLSPRSVQYLHTVLRQALSHAVRVGAIPRNPTDGVKPPRQTREGGTPERKVRAMSRTEAGAFLDVAKADRLSALWHVLLLGGIRPGEAFALSWEDVDLEGGRLHVRRALTRRGAPKPCECGHDRAEHGEEGRGDCGAEACACERFRGVEGWKVTEPKTARARRVVVLPDVAVSALKAYRKRQAEERLAAGPAWKDRGFVFTTMEGSPLDEANVYRRFRRVLKRAKLEGFRLYDLRHTCATLLLLAGENPKVVSERLGHASITLTLDTYSHVLPAMQEESARKLEAMFG